MSIGELSDEQARQLRSWRAEWLEIVASTAAADRPGAEAAIARIYEDHGARRPLFVWVRSPAEGLFAIAALRSWEGLLAVDRRFGAQAGKLLDPPRPTSSRRCSSDGSSRSADDRSCRRPSAAR